MKQDVTQKLVRTALLVALEIVLNRFFSINTPQLKIGFAFIPVAVCGMLYGPVWGAACGGLADFLGAILYPIGPYFPGFTFTACLSGALFGLCLRGERGERWGWIVTAVAIRTMVFTLLLNSFWLSILLQSTLWAQVGIRAFQCIVEIPVQLVVLRALGNRRLRRALAGERVK